MEIGDITIHGKKRYICTDKYDHDCETICVIRYIGKLIKHGRTGHGWAKARKATIERDKCCKSCGKIELLDVHHIDKDRSNNKLNNLITLCVYCHVKQPGHEHYARALSIRLGFEQTRRNSPIMPLSAGRNSP
jgi:5-methylcytosine-specific restriction endonuclease McrA